MIYISDTIKMTLQRKELCLCILCLVCRIYITELVHFFLFTTLYFLLLSHVTSHFFQEISGDLKTDSESQVHKTRNMFVW